MKTVPKTENCLKKEQLFHPNKNCVKKQKLSRLSDKAAGDAHILVRIQGSPL